MDKAFLVLRGTFTQRQFDAIGQIWGRLQQGYIEGSMPCIQIQKDSNIGLIRIESDGRISMETLFEDKE